MRRRALAPLVGVFGLACGSVSVEVDDETEAVTLEAPTPAPAEEEPREPEPEPSAGGRGKLLSLQQGDVACYVELHVKGRGKQTLHGSFELCPGGPSDASQLVGEKVDFTTGWTKVQAESCEGDPECTDSERVELITALKAVK